MKLYSTVTTDRAQKKGHGSNDYISVWFTVSKEAKNIQPVNVGTVTLKNINGAFYLDYHYNGEIINLRHIGE